MNMKRQKAFYKLYDLIRSDTETQKNYPLYQPLSNFQVFCVQKFIQELPDGFEFPTPTSNGAGHAFLCWIKDSRVVLRVWFSGFEIFWSALKFNLETTFFGETYFGEKYIEDQDCYDFEPYDTGIPKRLLELIPLERGGEAKKQKQLEIIEELRQAAMTEEEDEDENKMMEKNLNAGVQKIFIVPRFIEAEASHGIKISFNISEIHTFQPHGEDQTIIGYAAPDDFDTINEPYGSFKARLEAILKGGANG